MKNLWIIEHTHTHDTNNKYQMQCPKLFSSTNTTFDVCKKKLQAKRNSYVIVTTDW